MIRSTPIWIIAFAACVGCGGPSASYDSTVEGTVTVDGQLASRGRVMFHPEDDGPTAYGSIFPNGTYALRVGQGDLEDVDGGQLKSGEYIVTVVVNMPSVKDESVGEGGPPKPGARLMAAKYADKKTSDLRVTVKPGLNVVPLELEAVEEVEEVETDDVEEVESTTTDGEEPETEPTGEPAADSGAAEVQAEAAAKADNAEVAPALPPVQESKP